MKTKQKILIGLAVAVVILIVAVKLLMGNLNPIVKRIIEKVGTNVTGVPVTVGNVDIKIKEGSAAIMQLSVANPSGFSAEPMLDFGELAVKLDLKNKIINHVKVASPHILFEQKGTTSNFHALKDNMSKDAQKKTKDEPPADGEAAIIQIDLIEVTDAQINVISDLEDKTRNLTIKLMKFENLKGTGEEVGREIVSQLTTQIIKEVTGKAIQKELDKAIDKSVGDKLDGIGDKLNIFKRKE